MQPVRSPRIPATPEEIYYADNIETQKLTLLTGGMSAFRTSVGGVVAAPALYTRPDV